ncbi:MAG: class I SAM-dependent methyltransferase [Christensenella sp.]|nr:class I SAM-dependent methyltransferase [Christensenella sp.]
MELTGERFIPQQETNMPTIVEHYHRYHAIAPLMKGLRVLDAGSGAGYGSALLSDFAAHVTGVDISEEAVSFAAETYGKDNLQFKVGSVAELPFEDGVFDAVVSFEVIEHISPELQECFLNEVKRVLKPEGFFIVSSPNKEVYSDEIAFTNPYHLHELRINEFKGMIEKRFAFYKYYYQTYEPFSVIFDDQGEEKKDFNLINIHKDAYFHRMYSIAVCGNRPETIETVELNSLVLRYDQQYYATRNDIVYPFVSSLYYSKDEVLSEQQKMQTKLHIFDGKVKQSYVFDSPVFVHEIRWDPVELGFCELENIKICVEVEDGGVQTLESEALAMNAWKKQDGKYFFSSTDPYIIVKLDQTIRCVHCEANMKVLNNQELYKTVILPVSEETQSLHNEVQTYRRQFEDVQRQSDAYHKELKNVEDALQVCRNQVSKLRHTIKEMDEVMKELLLREAQKEQRIVHLEESFVNKAWRKIKNRKQEKK